jgi:hypothetical protein
MFTSVLYRYLLSLTSLAGSAALAAGVLVPGAPAATTPARAPHHERARGHRLHSRTYTQHVCISSRGTLASSCAKVKIIQKPENM